MPAEAAALVDELGSAFAAGDVDAALGAFAAGDAVMYAGSEPGESAVGRAEIRALLTELFARDERYLWRCESVRLVRGPQHVSVLAEGRLLVLPVNWREDDLERAQTLPYRVSGVLEAEPDGWRWRFCQGAEPVPA